MDLDPDTRRSLNEGVAALVERHAHEISQLPVTPQVTPDEVRSRLAAYDLEQPMLPTAAVEDVVEMLTEGIVHTPHPRYFGLFNPAPTFMGILGPWSTTPRFPSSALSTRVQAMHVTLGDTISTLPTVRPLVVAYGSRPWNCRTRQLCEPA